MNNSEKSRKTARVNEHPRQYINVLWRFGADRSDVSNAIYRTQPALDETKIYFGARDGSLTALDQLSGHVIWRFCARSLTKSGGIFSTPVIHDGKVYVGAGDKNVYCLDARTGKRIWVSLEADWKGSTLSIDPTSGSIFVVLETGIIRKTRAVYALDVRSGITKWKYTITSGPKPAIMAVPKQGSLIIEDTHGVCALDARSGKVLWTRKIEGGVNDVFVFDQDRSWVFWSSSSGSVRALKALDGEIQFHFTHMREISSHPFIFDDHAVFSTSNSSVECIDLTSKKLRWKFESSSETLSPPVVLDGRVFTGGNDGILYEIDLYSGRCLSETRTAGAITSTPLYDPTSRRFFFSVGTGRLYCACRQMSVYFFYDV